MKQHTALEKSSKVGNTSNQMLDMLFSLPLQGTFIYKMKVLNFIIKPFPTVKYSVTLPAYV